MKIFRLVLPAFALFLTAADDPQGSALLAAHNRARKDAGSPPLRWNDALARDAQAWAQHLSANGLFDHADQTAQGENLWIGPPGSTADDMVGVWIAEKRYFRPRKFPAISKTGNWADVGHYSQLIWHRSTELGCATAMGQDEKILVCRYSPAGNVAGMSPLPPIRQSKRRKSGS
jgi:hypothetical protein